MTSFPQGNAYEIDGVAATANGFVAVGYQYTGQGGTGPSQGLVWTSADGMTWQLNADPAFLEVSPNGVVAMGSDVYLFGDFSLCDYITDENQDCTEDPNAGTVIFKSSNGGAWQQLAQTQDILKAEFDGITTWNSTLVSWGYDAANGDPTPMDEHRWTDLDAHEQPERLRFDRCRRGRWSGRCRPGRSLPRGHRRRAADRQDFDRWAYVHGRNAAARYRSRVVGIVAGPGGMAAVGSGVSDEQPSVGFALYSPDGVTWSEANASDNSFDNGVINEIHSNGSGYVAVGSTVGEDFTMQTGRVWVSADGQLALDR